MTELLRLLEEGRAWSLEELADRLETSPEDIRRRLEYLEQIGRLRRTDGCGTPTCRGCTANCGKALRNGMPVFWEIP